MKRSTPLSTKSMTGKLALFFTLVSLLIGATVFVVFYNTLKWAEDEVGKKRILLDAEVAIEQYRMGKTGKLTIDYLTDAYDDVRLVPAEYMAPALGQSDGTDTVSKPLSFLGEVDEVDGPSRMVYATQFDLNGVQTPLILLSRIDEIELRPEEVGFSISIISAVFALLIGAFTLILMRLSKGLISPINSLSSQLETSSGDPEAIFSIEPEAAVEFTQLTEQLNHYREQINSLLKREQRFARYTSHELRTPLTIVKGAQELLERAEQTEFQSRQNARIKRAVKQMITMVDALLALVRYERSGEVARLHAINEAQLRDIIQNHQSYLENKPLQIELHVRGEPQVQATDTIVEMVVGNLLRNAIAATEQGCIEVTLTPDAIEVLDQGIGLSEQPFAEGHGLGLMLVEDLCLRYGWRFSLHNRKEGGCCAEIIFSAGLASECHSSPE